MPDLQRIMVHVFIMGECRLMPNEQFFYYIISVYHGRNKLHFDDDDELDRYAELDVYSASWLKQQCEGIYVAPLGHIILIPSQPSLTPFTLYT